MPSKMKVLTNLLELGAIITSLIPLLYAGYDLRDLTLHHAFFLTWMMCVKYACNSQSFYLFLLMLRVVAFMAITDSFTDTIGYAINITATCWLSIAAGLLVMY